MVVGYDGNESTGGEETEFAVDDGGSGEHFAWSCRTRHHMRRLRSGLRCMRVGWIVLVGFSCSLLNRRAFGFKTGYKCV